MKNAHVFTSGYMHKHWLGTKILTKSHIGTKPAHFIARGRQYPSGGPCAQYLISYGGSAFDARRQNEIFPTCIIFKSSLLF